MLQNRIYSRGIGVLAIRISGAALQLLLVALAVALFPIGDVGNNAILWSSAIISRVGGTLGLDLYLLRELPSLWAESRRDFGLRCKGLLVSLISVLAPLILFLACGLIWLVQNGSFSRDLAIAIPVVVVASALQRLWSCQLRARGQLMLGQMLDAVALPFCAVLALLASHTWAPSLFLAGQAAAIIAISLLMFGLLLSDWRQPGKFRILTTREWKEVVPLGAGSALSVLASRAPILFVGASSVSQAASYEIGQRINSAATLASASATAVLFPRVKGIIGKRATRQLFQELVSSAVLGLVPALVILLGLLVVGSNRAETLMGPEYAGAWLTAVVLTAAACVSAVTGLCHGVLAMAGSGRAFWVIAAIQASVTFAYGIFFFDGEAIHMAMFALCAEFGRGILLIVLMRQLFTKIARMPPISVKEII